MKNYYILESESRLSGAIRVNDVSKVIDLNYVRLNYIQFLDCDPAMFYIEGELIYEDFIENPIPLISQKMRDIFNDLNLKNIFYKPVCLANVKKATQCLYWLIIPKKIDCLSEETEFTRDNAVRKLRIDSKKVGFCKIFKIAGIIEDFIVVDEDIVSALEANVVGCEFTKIESV